MEGGEDLRMGTGDAAIEAREFAAHYAGPFDPADALFWLSSPAAPGPSGAPPPEAGLRELRRVVYGRRPDAQAVERLRVATEGVDTARRAALDALGAAERDRAERAAGKRVAVAAAGPARPPVGDARPAAAPPRRLLWSLVAAVLLLGAGVGAAGVLIPGPAAAAPARSLGTGLSASVSAGADIFDRPQRAGDRLLRPPGNSLVAASTRHLLDFERVSLYAVRDRWGDVCLLANDTEYGVTCADPAAFARSGVTLVWSAEELAVAPGTGQQRLHAFPYVATWRPDRRVTIATAEP